MQDEDFKKLVGIVEIDETYVGGKNQNKPLSKRYRTRSNKPGGGLNVANTGKVTVIGAISRKGLT